MDYVFQQLMTLWQQATDIWASGGWGMWGIAVVAMAIFTTGISVQLAMYRTGFRRVREDVWRHWIDRPQERDGPVGRLLDRVADCDTLEQTSAAFEEFNAAASARYSRDLRVMKICVTAAPLVGLLGTVTGMLATFGALASGSGGEKTMSMVASGISEALITTETGLVVALPGLFYQYKLGRTYQKYKAFLAHVETVCAQNVYRKQRVRRARMVQQAAAEQISKALQKAVS